MKYNNMHGSTADKMFYYKQNVLLKKKSYIVIYG